MSAPARERPALAPLYGMRVQRVDGPSSGLLCLTLFQTGEKRVLLLAFKPELRGVGLVRERPKGLAASGFVQRLRTLVEGSRLSAAEWLPPGEERAAALAMTFKRADATTTLVADFDAQAPNLFVLRADATIAAAADERARRTRFEGKAPPYTPVPGRGIAPPADDALPSAGERLLSDAVERTRRAVHSTRSTALRAALRRVERRIAAVRGDLERALSAPLLRREGHALLGHPEPIPRGASFVRAIDYASDPPCELEIRLDPALDARSNAERRFERARKLERGVTIASARLADAEREASELRRQLESLATEELPEADVRELAASPKPSRKQPPRVPYRTFTGHGDAKILVGKGALDNDTLTLTVARPHDHWLHARGLAGSHVVVPLERKASIAPELLIDAAHLAAHFSKARGEPTAEITHTERRFVRKQKGDAPGSVRIDRERVFVLRIEPERLARLLAAEIT